MKIDSIPYFSKNINSDHLFMFSMLVVNGGNYMYNLILGRILGPEVFADVAILITFLLILSFLGMTFQIVTTKFTVVWKNEQRSLFIENISTIALLTGIGTGLLILIFSLQLKQIFHTQSTWMFIVFGTGIPVYFLMSVNRGLHQGKNELSYLSKTYIFEMMGRLVATVPFLIFFPMIPPTLVVAAGITISFLFGLQPFQKEIIRPLAGITTTFDATGMVKFFALTAFYELTQIIINNSDIILVKHYFNNTESGLYSSLALIGRMVYFVAWMFVMLLLPNVIQLKNEGKDTQPILFKYVSYILILSTAIVFFTYFFPQFVIGVMFGEKYLGIAFLLWKYALATSLFAVANIFTYYFLSINSYFPVVISAFFGLVQIVLIVLYHNTLEQVVEMQILSMSILLFLQLVYFLFKNKN